MKNILAVTNHLRRTIKGNMATLEFLPAVTGDYYWIDGKGNYWRMYNFIDGVTYEQADNELMRECGTAFGSFQRYLSDFPVEELHVTILRFHDTPSRYEALHEAIEANPFGRANSTGREIEFALAREDFASLLTGLQASGDMPLRVTHNDTKLNNVIFNEETKKALCIIDLDTVMPGLSVNDFGDTIRFGASTAAEDEPDLSKVSLSMPLYKAYTEGFLAECGSTLTQCEKENLHIGAKMMTLECGVRFLADYLAGDLYFKISREGHNLDRCRAQFKLLSDMERLEDEMRVKT